MGISGKAWRRLAAAVAVPGAAIGALAGFGVAPAMASTARPQCCGIETLHGYVAGAGLSPEVPVDESGVFSDRGYIDLGGHGHTIYLTQGDIYFDTSYSDHTDMIAPRSCLWVHTEDFNYDITGGSGSYEDADGSGRLSIQVTAVLRRHHHMCEINHPIPRTIRVKIDARGTFSYGDE